MFCKYCGATLPDDAIFCSKCAREVSGPISDIVNNRLAEDEEVQDGMDNADWSERIVGQAQETAQAASKAVRRAGRQLNNGAKNMINSINAQRGYEDTYTSDSYGNMPGAVSGNHVESTYEETPRPVSSGENAGDYTLAEGEVLIRSYLCANIKTGFFSPAGKGHIYVTNKRMIYEGKSVDSRIGMETPIDSIGGIYAYEGKNIDIMKIIVGAVIGLSGVYAMGIRPLRVVGIIMIAIALFIVFLSFRRAYQLIVYSSKNTGSAINIGEGPSTKIGNSAFYTLQALPTKDTQRMASEIGALVQDIQQLGDRAIAKWRG